MVIIYDAPTWRRPIDGFADKTIKDNLKLLGTEYRQERSTIVLISGCESSSIAKMLLGEL